MLADRVKMQLGWPVTNIEICDQQIYDFIDQAVEWYSKYAGMTEEYLVFDSQYYTPGVGIKLDDVLTKLACFYDNGCNQSTLGQISAQYIDCDLNSMRKVIDVFEIATVENTGTSALFTLDYMFAQQTYFSYMLGSFGFDLITWHILKEWLDLRKKMFATEPSMSFDSRSQRLRIIPEPTNRNQYIGVLGCWVERSVKDILKERWVQRYTLALTMIALGHIRGKFGQVTLFGGGSIFASDLMTQGLDMKKELEDEILNKLGEVTPCSFYVG
jgi:hypothetical protein